LVVILLLTAVSLVLWADKLSPERLIERATTGWPPEFREANSKALIAGYIILGRPLDELVGPAQEAIQKRGFHELWDALQAGRQGEYIDICYHPQKVEDYLAGGRHLSQMSEAELEQLTILEGVSPEARQAAATLLVRRAIEDAGVEISSWYAFRIAYEHTKFDPLKIRLQDWQIGSQSPELRAATIIPLAQMYLAEHFVYWTFYHPGKYDRIIEKQRECPEDE